MAVSLLTPGFSPMGMCVTSFVVPGIGFGALPGIGLPQIFDAPVFLPEIPALPTFDIDSGAALQHRAQFFVTKSPVELPQVKIHLTQHPIASTRLETDVPHRIILAGQNLFDPVRLLAPTSSDLEAAQNILEQEPPDLGAHHWLAAGDGTETTRPLKPDGMELADDVQLSHVDRSEVIKRTEAEILAVLEYAEKAAFIVLGHAGMSKHYIKTVAGELLGYKRKSTIQARIREAEPESILSKYAHPQYDSHRAHLRQGEMVTIAQKLQAGQVIDEVISERERMIRAHEANKFNRKLTALELGMDGVTYYNWMRAFELYKEPRIHAVKTVTSDLVLTEVLSVFRGVNWRLTEACKILGILPMTLFSYLKRNGVDRAKEQAKQDQSQIIEALLKSVGSKTWAMEILSEQGWAQRTFYRRLDTLDAVKKIAQALRWSPGDGLEKRNIAPNILLDVLGKAEELLSNNKGWLMLLVAYSFRLKLSDLRDIVDAASENNAQFMHFLEDEFQHLGLNDEGISIVFLDIESFPEDWQQLTQSVSARFAEKEKARIKTLLSMHGGVQARVARVMGIVPDRVKQLMDRYGIEPYATSSKVITKSVSVEDDIFEAFHEVIDDETVDLENVLSTIAQRLHIPLQVVLATIRNCDDSSVLADFRDEIDTYYTPN